MSGASGEHAQHITGPSASPVAFEHHLHGAGPVLPGAFPEAVRSPHRTPGMTHSAPRGVAAPNGHRVPSQSVSAGPAPGHGDGRAGVHVTPGCCGIPAPSGRTRACTWPGPYAPGGCVLFVLPELEGVQCSQAAGRTRPTCARRVMPAATQAQGRTTRRNCSPRRPGVRSRRRSTQIQAGIAYVTAQ